MLALSNVFGSGSEKNAKILKPWWNVLNDYLVILLLAVPTFLGGLELALGKLTCLPVVDCSFSKNGTLLSENIYRSTCSAFYRSRNSTDANGKTITVLTGLKNLPEYHYVNSECSKTCVHWFHSYFSLFLFGQAFILLVLNNLWLKFPSTASFVNSFYALVAESYNLPIPGAHFLEDQKWRCYGLSFNPLPFFFNTDKQRHTKQERLLPASSDNQWLDSTAYRPMQVEDEALTCDLQTAVLAKALFEKISRFNGYIKASRQIQRLYLAQAGLQAVLTFSFFWTDFEHKDYLKGTVDCPIKEYLPYFYYNFTCSHNLATVFQTALVLFLILLSLSCVFCVISFGWTIGKLNFGKKDRKYRFDNELNSWKIPSDLSEAQEDMGFLLHLLHACNELYAVQFAICMSRKQYKKFKALILDSECPMEKLEKCVTEDKDGVRALHLRKLGGIPNALVQFDFTFYQRLRILELDRCGPLEADDFHEFYKFCELERLEVINCGLTEQIPKGLFEIKNLKSLNLHSNLIMHIQAGIRKLETLKTLVISSNKLETIDGLIATIPLEFINITNNPNIQVHAIENILACQHLKKLLIDNKDDILSKLNRREAEKFHKVTSPTSQENGEDQESDLEDGED